MYGYPHKVGQFTNTCFPTESHDFVGTLVRIGWGEKRLGRDVLSHPKNSIGLGDSGDLVHILSLGWG
jgi:hypothetical protein